MLILCLQVVTALAKEDFMAEVFKSLSVASPDGSSAPFDKDSRGLAYSQGCACLVLKD